MPSIKKKWYPGAIYHVTSRGNRRSPLFLEEKDFLKFISILDDTFQWTPYNLHAYCLMTNHYHLLIGTKSDPLQKLMHAINGSYAIWFNKKYHLSGHVFENRYTRHPVPSDYAFMTTSAYIHNNPRAAKLMEDPIHYPWSSYSLYCHPEIQLGTFAITSPIIKENTVDKKHLFRLQPQPWEWNKIAPSTIATRSPPKAFTRERIRQLFPTPLHLYYSNYVEREWKLKQLQKSNHT
ncbi:transposase [Evansella sp. AB-P1]|uniref:transposase n=1 Tax=Evansella sp. AB-P1 TaxID=3037653 RepID=UPI00241D9B49|nr:transposase [Evansella sp. AB-P1]MDG5786655.1 transposase [Evansella sp. AB-P1]